MGKVRIEGWKDEEELERSIVRGGEGGFEGGGLEERWFAGR